jgi:TPR repeat protein
VFSVCSIDSECVNHSKATKILLMQQSDHDLFVEAARARRRGDLPRAIKIYEMLAERGNVHGIVLLGSMYARGTGVPVDLESAEKLYGRAAERGCTEAIFQMSTV